MSDVLIARAKRIAEMPVALNRETTIEVFRQAVLEALDKAARETFNPPRNDAGASDADLPSLFPAIDAQVDRLANRYDVIMVSPVKRRFG